MESTIFKTKTGDLRSPQPARLSRGEIEELANDFAAFSGFTPGRTSLPDLIESLGGTIRYLNWEDWQNPEINFIRILGPSDFSIQLLSVDGPLRHNFTIAHELGHYIIHSRSGEISPMVLGRSGSNPLESEANMFAAGFLMPQKEFRDQWAKGKGDLEIAGLFMVSVSAVKVRKKVLGLETED